MNVLRNSIVHRKIHGLPAWAFILLWSMILLYLFLYGYNSLTRTRLFSPDSMNYVDVARNINEGRGITQTTVGFNQPHLTQLGDSPTPFTAQPPLYPISIALVSRLGMSYQDAALLIPVICYGLIILLSYRLALLLYNQTAAFLVLGALLYYPPLQLVCRLAWSEAPGSALALLSILLMAEWNREKSSSLPPFAAGLATGLAFGARYAMLPLFGVGLVYGWLTYRSTQQQMSRLSLYVAGFLIPAGLVLWHNFAAEGVFMPAANPSDQTFGQVLEATLRTLFGEYLDHGSQPMQMILLAVVVVGSFLWRRRKRRDSRPAESGWSRQRILLLALWAVAYSAFLVVQRSRFNFDPINARFILPAGIALILIGMAALVKAFRIRPIHAALFVTAMLSLRGREEILSQTKTPIHSVNRVIEASPRLGWIQQHTTFRDLIIGDNTMDVPFYFNRKLVFSFSGYPFTDSLNYDDLMFVAEKYGRGCSSIYLVLRDYGPIQVWQNWFGDFITDLVSNPNADYPGIVLKERLQDSFIFEIRR